MLTNTEQEILEQICLGSRMALQDIHQILGKVYDEELAYDLNLQASKYSRFSERAADEMISQGVVPRPLGILDRTKRWTMLQAGTALNVSTGHMAEIVMKEENRRLEQLEGTMGESFTAGQHSCELAEEFLDFERRNVQMMKSYLSA